MNDNISDEQRETILAEADSILIQFKKIYIIFMIISIGLNVLGYAFKSGLMIDLSFIIHLPLIYGFCKFKSWAKTLILLGAKLQIILTIIGIIILILGINTNMVSKTSNIVLHFHFLDILKGDINLSISSILLFIKWIVDVCWSIVTIKYLKSKTIESVF